MPRPIAIWHPRSIDGALHFVRPDPLPLGDHYATRRAIPALKPDGHQRICYFGESAAAGYLFAPHTTPADYLTTYLGRLGRYDVVDLARTNETLGGLLATVSAAAQLEPDLLVIFAGNNWPLLETPAGSPYFPSAEGRRAFATSWQAHGPFGPIESAARERLDKSAAALAKIARLAGEMGAAVLLVVPAVNLVDWQARQPVHHLPGDGVNRWHAFHQTASTAGGDSLHGAVTGMQALDDASTPAPFYYAGLHEPDPSEAARLLDAAVNASQFATHCFLPAPRATAMDQELIRRAAAVHKCALVDLPAVFAEHSGDPRHSRRLFLDYCHFTAEGTAVATAAIAAATHRALNPDAPAVTWPDLLPQAVLPRPGVLALARLGAAVHTAHRHLPFGPDDPLITYWLEAALAADPTIANAMLDLAAARLAPGPAVLTAAQQRNLASPHPLSLQHGWRYPHADHPLLAAIHAALTQYSPAAANHLHHLLLSGQWSVISDQSSVDSDLRPPASDHWLLTTDHSSLSHREPLARPIDQALPTADITPRAFFRAFWPQTHLGFRANGETAVPVTLTARLPGPSGTLAVHVNGRLHTQLSLNESWSTHTLAFPATLLRPGLNQLTLHWPPLPNAGPDPMAPVLDRLARGLPAAIHPRFGELWKITINN